jgi:hypothetical protein
MKIDLEDQLEGGDREHEPRHDVRSGYVARAVSLATGTQRYIAPRHAAASLPILTISERLQPSARR